MIFFSGIDAHRDLHVLTHSFPTLPSADLGAARTPGPRSRTTTWCAPGSGSANGPARPSSSRSIPCPKAATPAPSSSSPAATRSEEQTSELQSLMRISYAVLCLKKNKYLEDN